MYRHTYFDLPIYTYLHVYIYIYMHLNIHVYTENVHVFIIIYMYVYFDILKYTCIYNNIFNNKTFYFYSYLHRYIYIYIHIYIDIYLFFYTKIRNTKNLTHFNLGSFVLKFRVDLLEKFQTKRVKQTHLPFSQFFWEALLVCFALLSGFSS